MLRLTPLGLAAVAALVAAAPAIAHELLDHPVPSRSDVTPPSPAFQAGGPNAKWELLGTIPTGNPHTDLDFFTRAGETYASVGTLGAGANGGGQTIVALTQKGKVAPKYVTGHPSASCLSNPAAALSLQHDVEATPKGGTLLNTANALADPREAQLLIDATDASGRCHDQGLGGLSQAPRGGLEIIDISDGPDKPQEIGLTSHIGEAHTVNVDPKRPHIAYAVSSDGVAVDEKGVRANESTPASFGLDGFEVVDLSSCMNFPAGTTIEAKRAACRPAVYRYRYPSAAFAQGHTADDPSGASRGVYACHELEIYPDDRLTCGSGASSIVFDMSGAFDDNGTPADYSDDRPRGTPLPCAVRASSTELPKLSTGAEVTDCVTGAGGADLRVAPWLAAGAPSLEGVRFLGRAEHMGRGAGAPGRPAFDSTQDIDFSHEAELSHSGRYLIATDERGGGVAPPGASCDAADGNKAGNGGVHFYAVDRLRQTWTGSPEEAFASYARTPKGAKAIYRAPIRTGAQATICTAHVFQQIPGQNRIFMGWYSQGTQVIDFVERADGTVELKEAGYFIPASANEWVSQVYRVERNADGTFTYYGAAGDFNLGQGRSAIDLWKVTLLPPPAPRFATGTAPAAEGPAPTFPPAAAPDGAATTGSGRPSACAATAGLRSAAARPRGRGLRLAFSGARGRPVDVDVFRVTRGDRVVTRRVARFPGRRGAFTWPARGLRDGIFFARFRLRTPRIDNESLRVPLRRLRGRFRVLPAFETRPSCDVVEWAKLLRPVFGGRRAAPLAVTVLTHRAAVVGARVLRGGRAVASVPSRRVAANRVGRLRVAAARLPRGLYAVRLTIRYGRVAQTVTLHARRI